jgi:hypothetical protein
VKEPYIAGSLTGFVALEEAFWYPRKTRLEVCLLLDGLVLFFKAEREATWDKVVPILLSGAGGEKAV